MKELQSHLKVVHKETVQDIRPVQKQMVLQRVKIHKGQKVFQFDIKNNKLTEVLPEAPTLDMNNNVIRRKLVQLPGCLYCAAINKETAAKKFYKMLLPIINNASAK